MHAGADRRLRIARPEEILGRRRRRRLRRVGRGAAEAADYVPLRVEEIDRDLLRRLLQRVVDGERPVEAAQRVVRLEQVQIGRLHAPLPERRDVVHDVEATAVRPDHEIPLLDLDVVHRRVGQVLPERLPARAIVERYVDAVLRA